MKLYGNYQSPFVRHCHIAMKQEGLNFDLTETNYAEIAKQSPISKMPLLTDDTLVLTDSSSILKYIREKNGGNFLTSINDYENFALTNTVLDSVVNIFLFEKEGFGPEQIQYIGRQQARVNSGLKELNQRFASSQNRAISLDSALRCACFVDWGVFRKRISLTELDNLQALLDSANQITVFTDTAPQQ